MGLSDKEKTDSSTSSGIKPSEGIFLKGIL